MSHRIDHFICTDHTLALPLDWNAPEGDKILVYAREITQRKHKKVAELPWAIYLQGGPGCPCPAPANTGGWLGKLTETHRVLLLDQRGTGRSTPMTPSTILALGDAEAQAEYLSHHRQIDIIRDAEAFRAHLSPDKPWLALGQSYGGWCINSYLSFYPEGLSGVIYAGGMSSVGWHVDDVYRTTFQLAEQETARLYKRFPGLAAQVRRLADALEEQPWQLPRGGVLSRRGLQALGLRMYSQHGPASLRNLIELAYPAGAEQPQPLEPFLMAAENQLGWMNTPLFVLLHEAIYADGPGATNWAASRIRNEFPQFDLLDACEGAPLFTAEHMFEWMLDEVPGLEALKPCAELLAQKSDWQPLYDLECLEHNQVPGVAVIYHDDLCVGYPYSMDAARRINNIQTWVTSEYAHDGIGVDGAKIIERAMKLLDGDLQR